MSEGTLDKEDKLSNTTTQTIDLTPVPQLVESENGEHIEDLTATEEEYFEVDNLDELKVILNRYMERTNSKFVVMKKTKNFGMAPISAKELKPTHLLWQGIKLPKNQRSNFHIPFDGLPHVTVGRYILACEYGCCSKKWREKKGLRNRKMVTKKCGCPVKIYVKDIVKFPQYKVKKNTASRRRERATRLKEDLKVIPNDIKFEYHIVGRLPKITEHEYHDKLQSGAEFTKESIHRDLIIKIQQLSFDGRKTKEIRRILKEYVENEMFCGRECPEMNRRRFYPRPKDIQNTAKRMKEIVASIFDYVKDIQDTVKKIQNGGDQAFFDVLEDSMEENDESKKIKENPQFLFVYQSKSQQRLLLRYGVVIVIAEVDVSEHESVRRYLHYQMFALIVQTNVDYQVIGFFVVSKSRKQGMKEALMLFRQWNKSWQPKFYFFDFNEDFNYEVEEVFSDFFPFFSLHSCQLHWQRFLNKPSNGVGQYSNEVLDCLNEIAGSSNEDDLSAAFKSLEDTDAWKISLKLRTWFNDVWGNNIKHWVCGYRPSDLFILNHKHANVTHFLKEYEKAMLVTIKPKGFLAMCDVIRDVTKVENERYMKMNEDFIRLCTVTQNSIETCFLPVEMAQHEKVLRSLQNFQMEIVSNATGAFTVHCEQNNTRVLTVEENNISYDTGKMLGEFALSFGDAIVFPLCTCYFWQRYKLPCIHMYMVMVHYKEWRYDMLSPVYRSSYLLQFDHATFEAATGEKGNKGCQVEVLPILGCDDESKAISYCQELASEIRKVAEKYTNKPIYSAVMNELRIVLKEKNPKEKSLNAVPVPMEITPLKRIPLSSTCEIRSVNTSNFVTCKTISFQNHHARLVNVTLNSAVPRATISQSIPGVKTKTCKTLNGQPTPLKVTAKVDFVVTK